MKTWTTKRQAAAVRHAVQIGGMAVWMVAALGLAPTDASSQQAEKPKAEAPPDAVRAELGALFQVAQEQLKAGNASGALTALLEADKIADRTPFENLTLNRVRGSIAVVARDFALARRSLEAIVNDPRLQAGDRRSVLQSLVPVVQRLNDHAAAVRYAREFFAGGGHSEAIRSAMVRSQFSIKDWAGVLQEAPRVVKELEGASRKPDEELLKIWATSAGEAKNDGAYMAAMEVLVRHHPSADYWGDLISRLQNRAGFADRLLLDAYRLMRHTQSMVDAEEFTNMAQLAIVAALPAEAQAVLEEGFKAGVLGKGPAAAAHRDLKTRADRLVAQDKGQLTQSQASAESSGDAWKIFAVGEAAVSYGDLDRGLGLMEKAISMGLPRNADDARLRMGVALLKAGRRAPAEAQLHAVKGSDGVADLARYWLMAVR